MFRCMTERPDKQAGFVIDMNMRRAIINVVSYAQLLHKKNINPKDAIHYLYT